MKRLEAGLKSSSGSSESSNGGGRKRSDNAVRKRFLKGVRRNPRLLLGRQDKFKICGVTLSHLTLCERKMKILVPSLRLLIVWLNPRRRLQCIRLPLDDLFLPWDMGHNIRRNRDLYHTSANKLHQGGLCGFASSNLVVTLADFFAGPQSWENQPHSCSIA
mgnify:CR=1 FL=1